MILYINIILNYYEKQISSILNQGYDLLIFFDKEGFIQKLSYEALKILKYQIQELKNRSLDLILTSKRSKELLDDTLKVKGKIRHQKVSLTKVIENIIVRSIQNKNEKEELIDVNQMIRQEIMFFDTHLYFKHRIEKKYNLAPGLDKVKMVYSDLLQLFDNLINHAIEVMYDSSQKRLTINTFQDEKHIYIESFHTAVGISRKFIENIFDPFFSTKKKNDEQSINKSVEIGLGLPVCLTLIKKYGGDIEVKSQLGEGSTFMLKIPGFHMLKIPGFQTDK